MCLPPSDTNVGWVCVYTYVLVYSLIGTSAARAAATMEPAEAPEMVRNLTSGRRVVMAAATPTW